jgi:hypothetical protein
MTVANNFVTDKNSGEVMTVGYVEMVGGSSCFLCIRFVLSYQGVQFQLAL